MLHPLFIIAYCITILITPICCLFSENQVKNNSIKWLTNYEQAISQAKESSKPIVMLYTGSDWCSWCTKLETEVFNTQEFAEAINNKFIFLKLDYPLYTTQDPQLKAQNKELQTKFDVRSFPTVVLYDTQLNQRIGTSGYRPGGGKQYADFLSQMIKNYSSYKQKVGVLNKNQFSGSELKLLYEQAKKLEIDSDMNKIVMFGIESNESLYFLTERYSYLANEGQIHSNEALRVREQLMVADPHNEKQIPYQIAVIEFEKYCEEMEKENYAPELAIAPLQSYIEKFGSKDKNNLWRLQMIISQVYLDKNQMPSALKYAQDSYETAPATVQPEIAKTIQNIRSQIHSSL